MGTLNPMRAVLAGRDDLIEASRRWLPSGCHRVLWEAVMAAPSSPCSPPASRGVMQALLRKDNKQAAARSARELRIQIGRGQFRSD